MIATATNIEDDRYTALRRLNVHRKGCLALNASYEPLAMIPVKRAIRLINDGRAEIVEVDGTRIVRSENAEFPCPSVIRLVRFVRVPRKFRKSVNNTFLMARDGYRCQYCGRHRRELRQREFLTREHVVPQSHFERKEDSNVWTNVVTACSNCNNKKADRTPEEAGMTLLSTPTEPHFVNLVWAVRKLTALQRKYIAQFYGDDVLETIDH